MTEASAIGANRGLFITLEGGEGSGKSLQAKALAQRLEEQGLPLVLTREPGGTRLGERLRDILLELSSGLAGPPVSPLTETLLFIAARAELVACVIAPAKTRGEIVICDRFADSTRAYQGFGRGIDMDLIKQLNTAATQGLKPGLTVLLDLPVADGLKRTRAAGQADRFEQEELSFHERVRDGYLTLAREEPDRWLVVDSTQPREAVAGAIWQRVEELLQKAEGPKGQA